MRAGSQPLTVLLWVLIVLAVVGYAVGTGGTSKDMAALHQYDTTTPRQHSGDSQPATVPQALSYEEMASGELSPNAHFVSELKRLMIAEPLNQKPLDQAPSAAERAAAAGPCPQSRL